MKGIKLKQPLVSQALKDAREKAGFTQGFAYNMLGFHSKSSLANLESGKYHAWSLDKIVRACELFGFPLKEIKKLIIKDYENSINEHI